MKKTTGNAGTIGHVVPGRGKLPVMSVAGPMDGDCNTAELPVRLAQRSAGVEIPEWQLHPGFNTESAYQGPW